MMTGSDVSSMLGKTAIVLVVEDMLTRDYLMHAWGVDNIHFGMLIAGGHNVVKGCVEDFRRVYGDKARHVFGVNDRDFGTSNVASWNDPQTHVFRGSYHEAENYLLDWDALAGCDINQTCRKLSAAAIKTLAEAEARKQVHWLACRKVLATFQKKIGEDFPKVPKVTAITDIAAAEAYIVTQTWMTDLPARCTDIVDHAKVHAELVAADAAYQAALADGSWVKEFSGKESTNF